jgi:hypothetical protein
MITLYPLVSNLFPYITILQYLWQQYFTIYRNGRDNVSVLHSGGTSFEYQLETNDPDWEFFSAPAVNFVVVP